LLGGLVLIEDLANRYTPSTLEAYRSPKSHGLRSKKRRETVRCIKARTDKSSSNQPGSANLYTDLGYRFDDEMRPRRRVARRPRHGVTGDDHLWKLGLQLSRNLAAKSIGRWYW